MLCRGGIGVCSRRIGLMMPGQVVRVSVVIGRAGSDGQQGGPGGRGGLDVLLHGMAEGAGHDGHAGHASHALDLADRPEMGDGADGMPEDDSLAVALALSLGFDAIVAPGLLFAALDASLAAG